MKNVTYIFTLIILNSCANLSSLQDGRTLKKNEIEMTPIVSVSKYNDPEFFNGDKKDYLPTIGLRTKFGVVNNFDAGFVLDISTNFGITSKYQFVGNSESKFNCSMGFDFGTNLAVLLFKRKIYYYSVPLYLSYNPNKSISFFITTRFINNFDSFNPKYNTEINKLENKQNKFAITYGILFGKKNKYGIEISNYSNNLFLPTQLSLGYNIKL